MNEEDASEERDPETPDPEGPVDSGEQPDAAEPVAEDVSDAVEPTQDGGSDAVEPPGDGESPAGSGEFDRDGIGLRFSKLVDVVWGELRERQDAASWFAQWIPLFTALHELGTTVVEFAWRVRSRVTDRTKPYFADGEFTDLKERFEQAVEASPEAADIIFGFDDANDALTEVFSEGKAGRKALREFVSALETALDGVMERLIDWGLGVDAPEVTFEEMLTFLEHIEELLSEAIERWLVPTIIDDRKMR